MGQLTVLVTGAAGYVGQAVVSAAQLRGHHVLGLIRADADLAVDELGPTLTGVDVVIHCAASLSGDEVKHARDTVLATRRLVAAMEEVTPKPKMVLVSSLSVYAGHTSAGILIDETSVLEPDPDLRDAYTRAKLMQEAAIAASSLTHCIARVGAIWGQGHLWNAHIGIAFGPLLIRLGSEGEIPLAHVQNAALALVLAAEAQTGVINIVDDRRPSPMAYVTALRKSGWPKMVLPVSWRVLDLVGTIPFPNKPGLLKRPTLRARMMPRHYSNVKLHELGWRPVIDFETGMRLAQVKK